MDDPETNQSGTPSAGEVCLMLRAHAERRWLDTEVLPVVRELETPGALPDELRGAAASYLEAMWTHAELLAHETEVSHARLKPDDGDRPQLEDSARRYHASLRHLRENLSVRVAGLLRPA